MGNTNLKEKDIAAVVSILDGWQDSVLTWHAFIAAIRQHLGISWSRQALHRHTRIKNAFALKKKSLQKCPTFNSDEDRLPPDLRKALERIKRLENQNERLEMENNRLLEQFRRWNYNAFNAKGIGLDVLDRPIPAGNRGCSRDE